MTPQERTQHFLAVNGLSRLYDNLPLTPDSHVLDVGGYHGVWSKEIFYRYTPHIHIIEPHPDCYASILRLTEPWRPRPTLYNFALSDRRGKAWLSSWGEGSTIISPQSPDIRVPVIQASEFFLGAPTFDLVSLNVEGSEYSILENLILHNLLKTIPYLQIQFHDRIGSDPERTVPIERCHERRQAIQDHLRNTHVQVFNVNYVWECWQKV